MSEKLKPCPFCGGEVQLIGEFGVNCPCVECPNCKIRTAWQIRDEAIYAWNRRTKK